MIPTREQLHWDYFDVSDDPRARHACNAWHREHGDVVIALESAGFRPIGRALGVLHGDRARMLSEIWVEDGGRTMISLGPGGSVEMGTLFEDGTLVKTGERPPLVTWLTEAVGVGARMRGCRHDYETAPGGFADVLARHRARIEPFERESPVVCADTMKAHFAMRLRVSELRDARMRPQLVIAFWLRRALAIGFGLGVMLVRRAMYGRSSVLVAEIAGLSGWLVAVIPASRVSKWWLAPLLVRLGRAPAPRPAAELLAMAERVPSGPPV